MLEAYSEPWFIQNPSHIQNTVKDLQWNFFKKYLPTALKKSSYIFLYFGKWNFLALVFRKLFLYFRKRKPRKKFVIFQKTELFYISGNKNIKKVLIFQEITLRAQKVKRTHSYKVSYIS